MNMLTGLVLIYLIVLMWFGFCGERHSSSGRAFLTSGGRAGALLCALSLVSTIIGGSATLGMGSLAQKIGSGAFWWLGVGAVGLLLHGWIAPKIRALPAVTLPEVVGVVAGRNAERWAGVIIAVSWIAVTAAQFVALHTLLLTLSSPLAAEVLYVMIAGVVIVHTITGGQSAVIRTDAFQAVLLLGGFTAAAFWLLGDRPDAVMALDPVPLGDRFGPWDLGRMMLLVGITYVVGPDMFSRTFTARDGQSARFAAWIASPCLVWFGVVVTGLALLNLQDPQPVAGWLECFGDARLAQGSARARPHQRALRVGRHGASFGLRHCRAKPSGGRPYERRALLRGRLRICRRCGRLCLEGHHLAVAHSLLFLRAGSGPAASHCAHRAGEAPQRTALDGGRRLRRHRRPGGQRHGDEVWTFAGMGVSAAFAVASRFKAPAGGSDAFGSLR